MTLDFRPEVLKRLGAVLIEDESLEGSWKNAEGDERDRVFEAVQREHWQACTDRDEVFETLDRFPKNSQQLIALLFAESVAHIANGPKASQCRRAVWDYLHGRISDKEMEKAGFIATEVARETELEKRKHPPWKAVQYAALAAAGAATNQVFALFTDDVAKDAVWASSCVKKPIAGSFIILQNELIGPDGPLKLLVETPSRNSLSELLARWDVALECAHKVFK